MPRGWGKLRDNVAKLKSPPGWGKVVATAQAKFKAPPGWGTIREIRAKLKAPPGWGRIREIRTKLKAPSGWGEIREPTRKVVVPSGWGADPAPEGGPKSRKWAIILVCICVLGVLGLGANWFFVNRWEERHLLRQAQIYLQFNDDSSLRNVFEKLQEKDPKNVEACRIWAESLTKHANREALVWRRKVVELAPGSLDDRLALAESMLRFDRTADAIPLLEAAEAQLGGGSKSKGFAADVMERSGLLAAAESHHAEAARLAPVNPLVQLRMDIIQLHSRQPGVRATARASVERLLSNPQARVTALRALISDALRDDLTDGALPMVGRLLSLPAHNFDDRLLYLNILRRTGSPDFSAQLTAAQKDAARDPKDLEALLGWMNANNLELDARAWALSLPARLMVPPAIQVRIADSFAGVCDWRGLEAFVSKRNWGDFDFMRHAFLSRCQRDNGDLASSRSLWEDAVADAPNTGEELKMLARSAVQWGSETDAVDVLWKMAKQSDNPGEALDLLFCRYLANRDTDGLYRVASRMVECDLMNDPARNNLVLFSLLLKKDRGEALNIAQVLYEKEPANWEYSVTYAYALYCRNQKKFARDILRKLDSKQQQQPLVAAYYSVILAETGQQKEAEQYRQIAKRACLLPEEEQLVADSFPAR